MKFECKRELWFLYKWNCSALESLKMGHKKKSVVKFLFTFRKKHHENPEKLSHKSL